MKLADLGISLLELEISTFCNIRCSFCPIDQRAAPPREFMPFERIRAVLDQLAQDGSLDYVGFQHLNEPLLHPELERILGYAHGLGLPTYLSTNGTILTPKVIDLLARTSPTRLKVSVQEVNPQTFARVKGTRMKFDEFVSRVAALVERRASEEKFRTKIELDVAVPALDRSFAERVYGISQSDRTINSADEVLRRYLKEFLEAIARLAPSAKLDGDTVNIDLTRRKTFRGDYVPMATLIPGVTLELKDFFDWIGIEKRRPVTHGSCPRLETVVVNYSGNLQLCCIDTHGKTSIGNVFERPLHDILAEPENTAKVLRAPGYELPTEHCRACVGAETRRGVVYLNLVNRFKYGYPKFVPEPERDARAALDRLKRDESARGNQAVVAAIDEALTRPARDTKRP